MLLLTIIVSRSTVGPDLAIVSRVVFVFLLVIIFGVLSEFGLWPFESCTTAKSPRRQRSSALKSVEASVKLVHRDADANTLTFCKHTVLN